jgi:hypothetical protein
MRYFFAASVKSAETVWLMPTVIDWRLVPIFS